MVVSFVGITTFLLFLRSRLPASTRIIILKEQESNKFLPEYLEGTNIFLIFAAWNTEINERAYG